MTALIVILLILNVVTHKKLVIAEKGNTGNLFLMLSAILFGVSLGMSLFQIKILKENYLLES